MISFDDFIKQDDEEKYNDKQHDLLEIKRLNNIINEFEEELKWERKICLSLNERFTISRIDTLINKLQELKGSDKN